MVAIVVGAVASAAQQLSTTRLELTGPAWNGVTGALIGTKEINPLVIATTSPSAQPIRFYVGTGGALRAMEIGPLGSLWSRGPFSLGSATTAAPLEMMRISTISGGGGTGLTIDLQGTVASTGLRLLNVGLSGSEDAGIVAGSQANGIGTAIRIGGPAGSARPTFATGIDITGGTGLRYNALSSGDGTALQIGGSTAPRRGIEITTTGAGHIGLLSMANSAGTAVMGSSQSASYPPPTPMPGVGVVGIAASNSNASADSVTGMFATAMRGGRGGTKTTTIGLRARAASIGEDHSGTSIGLHAEAESVSPGTRSAIAGAFRAPSDQLAIAVTEGDVFLGSETTERPRSLERSTMTINGRSTTHLYHTMQSGSIHVVNVKDVVVAAGQVNDLDVGSVPIIRMQCNAGGIELTGLAGAVRGRVLTIVNTACPLTVSNESAQSLEEHRIRTAGQADLMVPIDGVITVWYDEEIERWRVVSCSW